MNTLIVMNNIVRINKLHKNYYSREGVVVAIDDITLDIKKGETVALIGTNGSGNNQVLNVTIVDINTAVHYGKVKAAKYSEYSTFNYDNMDDYTNINLYYLDGDTTFIPSICVPLLSGADTYSE